MKFENLLIISNTFPDKKNMFIGGIFVKEQLSYIRKYFKKVTVISPVPRSLGFKEDDKYCKNYFYENVKVYFPRFSHLPIKYFRNRLGDNYFKTINKLIKKENIEFDLIHAHFTWPSGYAGAKLREKYSVPLVITARGFDIYDVPFRNKLLKKKVEYALNSADYITTVSNSNLNFIKKLSIKKPAEVIPNGVNIENFKSIDKVYAREKLGLPQEKNVILTAGNLVEVKGHRYLILAIKKIVKQRNDILLVIVGSGNLKQRLERLIKELNLQSYVKLVGAKLHEEIPLWMNASDVFVLPSLSEGRPNVVLEAMACEIPILATSVGGTPEIVKENYNGILFPPKRSDILAEKISMILKNDELRKKLGENGLQFIKNNRLYWEETTKKFIRIYKEIEE